MKNNIKRSDKKIKKLDKLMQSSFARKASIDKSFQENLREKLISDHSNHISKFNGQKEMSKKKNHSEASSGENISKLKKFLSSLTTNPTKLALGGLSLVFIISTFIAGGWYIFQASQTQSQKNQFGSISTVKGEVKIERDDREITVKEGNQEKLEKNDLIKTSLDTIADAEFDFGRISLASQTQAKISADGNQGEVQLEKGEIYARSTDNHKISLSTPESAITVKKGASLTNRNSQNLTNLKAIAGEIRVSATKSETKVTKTIEPGKEVDIQGGEISNTQEMERAILKSEFVSHNLDKDEKHGYDKGTGDDLAPPEISIINPKNDIQTDSSPITIKAKSNEDGWAYYNKKWNPINADEAFTYDVKLQEGENTVEIKAKDKNYNIATKTITINYNKPYNTKLNNVTAQYNGIYLKWSAEQIESGFKYLVRRSTNSKDSTAKNNKLLIAADSKAKEWVDTSTNKGTKYYYHVILLNSNGKELDRTSTKGALAINQPPQEPKPTPEPEPTPPPEGNSCNINVTLIDKTSASRYVTPTLAISQGSGSITLSWSLSGDCGEYTGFKVVYNQTGNPTYPPGNYVGKTTNSYKITNLESGKWYIRVGTYKDGQVTNYSNQLSVSI